MLSPAVPSTGAVVLIIPGSGPTDRDGNNPLRVRASTYRLLAAGLGERGISSVRIDKRGMYASAAAIPDANKVTIADYATDVLAWVATIRQKTGAPCVWLLGHSEGALVALVAAQEATDLCGLVLVSAAGRPLGAVLSDQLRDNPAMAPLLDQAFAVIDSLEAGRPVDLAGMDPVLLSLFHPEVQPFLIDAVSYDPAALLANYEKPVLILQGQRDLQVGERDARLLGAVNSRARLVLLPDTNHVLKSVTSNDRAANITTYEDPNLPLAPGVVDTIAQFILTEAAAR